MAELTKKVKHDIKCRDGHKCVKCGYMGSELTIDHIIPKNLGGTNAKSNLQTLCFHCNNKKASRVPFRQKLKMLWNFDAYFNNQQSQIKNELNKIKTESKKESDERLLEFKTNLLKEVNKLFVERDEAVDYLYKGIKLIIKKM